MRRRARTQAVVSRVPQRTRWRGQQGRLARRRRLQNASVVGVLVVALLLLWLFSTDGWMLLGGAIVGVLLVPVAVTLLFDRQSGS